MLERIKALMEVRGLSPSQFADETTLPRPVVSHILSERNKPSLEAVQKILAAYPDVSSDWLLNGEGVMLRAGESAGASEPTPAKSPEERSSPKAPKRPKSTTARANATPPAAVPAAAATHSSAPAAPRQDDELPAVAAQLIRPDRTVRRILIFYSDGSFSEHRPLSGEESPF